MHIIEISAHENGSHRNQKYHGKIPQDWGETAFIREDVSTFENFPFGTPTVEEIDGVMTVTAWEAGEMPKAEPEAAPEPTLDERVTANEASISSLEDAICEMDAANSEAMAAIEDALCELDI